MQQIFSLLGQNTQQQGLNITWRTIRRFGDQHIENQVQCLAINKKLTLRRNSSALNACAVLLFNNLAERKWMFVECTQSFLEDIFCMQSGNVSSKASTTQELLFCKKSNILKENICFHIVWQGYSRLVNESNPLENSSSLFAYIFNAVESPSFPPFFLSSQSVTFVRLLNLWKNVTNYVEHDSYSALSAQSVPPLKLNFGVNLFDCGEGISISITHVCDEVQDCRLDKSDERNCLITENTVCHLLSDFTQLKNCKFHSYHENKNKEWTQSVRQTKSHHSHFCTEQGMLACSDETPICYALSHVCIFNLTASKHIYPCPHGEHMQQCKKYQCNMKFKCPEYYCIPWQYVCDGKWDCPSGQDESASQLCGNDRTCKTLFQCKNSQICIHLGDICDDFTNCPQGDDEFLCMLNGYQCPSQCQCFQLAVTCSSGMLSSTLFQSLQPYYYLQIDNCSLDATFDNMKTILQFPHVIFVIFTQANIVQFCQLIIKTENIMFANFSSNSISHLVKNCFHKNKNIIYLSMSSNHITHVEIDTFINLKKLQILDLSHNPLYNLVSFRDLGIAHLKYLIFLNISATHQIMFENISLRILHTDNYHYCSHLPHHAHCTIQFPWYIGQKSLLPTISLKILFYCISSVILTTSVVSSILQKVSLWKKCNKTAAFGTTVVFVNGIDISCSVSLSILWVADVVYKDDFLMYEILWRSSVPCFTVFCLSLNFALLCPILLTFLSIQRYNIVSEPFDSKFRDTSFVRKHLGSMTGVSMIISVSVTLLNGMLSSTRSLTFFLCSPFVDPTGSAVVVRILTWFIAVVVSGASVSIITSHIKLVLSLKASQKSIAFKQRPNKGMVAQLTVASLSNILCWIPTSIIHLTSSFLERYPTEILIWTQVAVTPLNSVINPIVFIATTAKKICGTRSGGGRANHRSM